MRFLKMAKARKRKPLSVALTESELERINTAATKAGMKPSVYIREAALHYPILEGVFENLLIELHGKAGAEEAWERVENEEDQFEEKMKKRVEAAAKLYKESKKEKQDD